MNPQRTCGLLGLMFLALTLILTPVAAQADNELDKLLEDYNGFIEKYKKRNDPEVVEIVERAKAKLEAVKLVKKFEEESGSQVGTPFDEQIKAIDDQRRSEWEKLRDLRSELDEMETHADPNDKQAQELIERYKQYRKALEKLPEIAKDEWEAKITHNHKVARLVDEMDKKLDELDANRKKKAEAADKAGVAKELKRIRQRPPKPEPAKPPAADKGEVKAARRLSDLPSEAEVQKMLASLRKNREKVNESYRKELEKISNPYTREMLEKDRQKTLAALAGQEQEFLRMLNAARAEKARREADQLKAPPKVAEKVEKPLTEQLKDDKQAQEIIERYKKRRKLLEENYLSEEARWTDEPEVRESIKQARLKRLQELDQEMQQELAKLKAEYF